MKILIIPVERESVIQRNDRKFQFNEVTIYAGGDNMVHSGTDGRNSDIGAMSDFSDDNEETGVEQRSGCRIPGCKCDGRVVVIEWSSNDMTETDDSEYEGSIDRANRLYMESYNYDLSEGMTPKTYNPPLRRNRRRRYEVRKKNEVDVKEPFLVTSDRVFQVDQESPKLEPTVQPRTVVDDDIPKSRDKPGDRGSSTGSDMDMSNDEDSNLCDRPATESATEWDSEDSQDPYNEYWSNVYRQAEQVMRQMTGTDANLLGDKYPDVVKELVRRTMKLLDEHYALPVEQRSGCEDDKDTYSQSELTGLTGCGAYSSTSDLWEWVDRLVTEGNMARSGIKTDFPCQEHSDIVDRPITESVSARVKNETMYPSYEHSDKQSVLVDIPGTESLMSRS